MKSHIFGLHSISFTCRSFVNIFNNTFSFVNTLIFTYFYCGAKKLNIVFFISSKEKHTRENFVKVNVIIRLSGQRGWGRKVLTIHNSRLMLLKSKKKVIKMLEFKRECLAFKNKKWVWYVTDSFFLLNRGKKRRTARNTTIRF